jgi:ABC-type dipeptide/oligopeptide/nickel transport system permease subunit
MNTNRFLRNKGFVLFSALALVLVLVAVFAPVLAGGTDPAAGNLKDAIMPPSAEHICGTDKMGRDIYARVLYGARVSLVSTFLLVVLVFVIGTVMGVISGYFGGWVDSVIMRIVEAMMAIPPIVLALALVAIFGRSLPMLTVVLGISSVPAFARMMRGQVLTVRDLDYVAASRIRGNSDLVTMVKHVLPNCLSPMIIVMTQSIGGTILAESGLSFLGAGVLPPTASWGAMVNDGYTWLEKCPVFALSPGVAVILLVLAFNIFGDGLRDALDPRLRGGR